MQFLIANDQTLNTLVWIKGDGFGPGVPVMTAQDRISEG